MYGSSNAKSSSKPGQRQQQLQKSKLSLQMESNSALEDFTDENRVETMISQLQLDGSKTPSHPLKLYKDSPSLSSRKALNGLQTPLLNRLTSSSARRNGVLFAHDPELDSTPFVYKKSKHNLNTLSTSLSSNDVKRETTELLTPSRRASLRSKPVTTTTPVHAFVSSQTTTDDGLFGIGDFRDVFITEEDLERAKEKMDSEKTNSDIARELTQFLKTLLRQRDSECTEEWKQCTISYSHVEIGKGHCFLDDDCIWWKGAIHPLLEPNFETPIVSVAIPFDQCTLLRSQKSDDNHVLFMSIHGRYLQLVFNDAEYAALIGNNSKGPTPVTSRNDIESEKQYRKS